MVPLLEVSTLFNEIVHPSFILYHEIQIFFILISIIKGRILGPWALLLFIDPVPNVFILNVLVQWFLDTFILVLAIAHLVYNVQ